MDSLTEEYKVGAEWGKVKEFPATLFLKYCFKVTSDPYEPVSISFGTFSVNIKFTHYIVELKSRGFSVRFTVFFKDIYYSNLYTNFLVDYVEYLCDTLYLKYTAYM